MIWSTSNYMSVLQSITPKAGGIIDVRAFSQNKANLSNVNDLVVTGSFANSFTSNITFSSITSAGSYSCVYWNAAQSKWATDGVTYKSPNVCNAAHWTEFTIVLTSDLNTNTGGPTFGT